MNPKDFIELLLPAARMCQRLHGIPVSFTLAQAALESRWGESMLARQAYNLFGVKADKSWKGDYYCVPTGEVVNGKSIVVQAAFRKYGSWLECINDRAKFFRDNPRYKAAWQQKTGPGWVKAVAEAGYATDPNYADSLLRVIAGRNMTQYDLP